jgi:hypothetical protein
VLICSALVPVSVGFPVRRSTASRKWVSRKWEYRKVVFIRSIPLVRTLLQKWTEAFSSEVGYLCWSHEGEYIYFQDKGISAQNYHNRIVRFRRSDRKIQNIVEVKNVGRLTTGTIVDWFGLAPDDSPLFAR